jgi:hypothetical protein
MSFGKTDWKRGKLALAAWTTASVEASARSFGYGDVYGAASIHERITGLNVGAVFDRSDVANEDSPRSLRADRNVAQALDISDNGVERYHRIQVADLANDTRFIVPAQPVARAWTSERARDRNLQRGYWREAAQMLVHFLSPRDQKTPSVEQNLDDKPSWESRESAGPDDKGHGSARSLREWSNRRRLAGIRTCIASPA